MKDKTIFHCPAVPVRVVACLAGQDGGGVSPRRLLFCLRLYGSQ